MHERIARSADFHERPNLRSGENVVRLVRHCWFEDTEAQNEGESEQPSLRLSIAILRFSNFRMS
jgi:hypothetical protein